MAKIWIISDTHWGHDNIYKFLREDKITRVRYHFDNSKEADEAMLELWNNRVQPQDHVYHLGDVAMKPQHIGLAAKCNGHKRLVLGNHDQDKVKLYSEAGFQKIYGMKHLAGLWLTHAPMYVNLADPRLPLGNIHGHIHQNESPTLWHFNACVERINYAPIELDSIIGLFELRKQNHYENLHP